MLTLAKTYDATVMITKTDHGYCAGAVVDALNVEIYTTEWLDGIFAARCWLESRGIEFDSLAASHEYTEYDECIEGPEDVWMYYGTFTR